MPDNRDVTEVLKSELEFLEKSGYHRSPRQPWRAGRIFEDSPICPNYESRSALVPCSECVLFQFVPPEQRKEPNPCRFIRLTASGETPNSMYGYADQREIEVAVQKWARTLIASLEAERSLQEAAYQTWM